MKVINQHELKHTIKMQTKFKDIAQYYLGTGLEIVDTSSNTNGYLNGINSDEIYFQGGWYSSNRFKPLLRSLDSLTKPITVKGYNDDKEFVPLDEIQQYDINSENILLQQFWIVNRLLQWHFNVFNLPETEYIKID